MLMLVSIESTMTSPTVALATAVEQRAPSMQHSQLHYSSLLSDIA